VINEAGAARDLAGYFGVINGASVAGFAELAASPELMGAEGSVQNKDLAGYFGVINEAGAAQDLAGYFGVINRPSVAGFAELAASPELMGAEGSVQNKDLAGYFGVINEAGAAQDLAGYFGLFGEVGIALSIDPSEAYARSMALTGQGRPGS
jgi:hypothetical protein